MARGNEALDFLMGAGVPSAKFPTIGSKVVGTIESYEKRQERDMDGNKITFDDGEPKYQLVFTLDTGEEDPTIDDDDGMRKLYTKPQMLQAIREAIKKSGHRGDIVGGRLGIVYFEDGEPPRRGFSGPKQFRAKFEPPAETDDLGRDEPDESYAPDLTSFGEEPF